MTNALEVGANGDAKRAFNQGVSSPVLDKAVHVLYPGTVEAFREKAKQNRKYRRGPFKTEVSPLKTPSSPVLSSISSQLLRKRSTPPSPSPQSPVFTGMIDLSSPGCSPRNFNLFSERADRPGAEKLSPSGESFSNYYLF